MFEYDDYDEDAVYHYIFYHLILGVAYKQAAIDPDWSYALRMELEAFLESKGCHSLAVAILPDHVHLVYKGNLNVALDSMVLALKAHLASWIQDHRPTEPAFAWQEGYGCWTLGPEGLKEDRAYLEDQENFHRQVPFLEEYPMLLQAHGIEYEEEDLFQPLQ